MQGKHVVFVLGLIALASPALSAETITYRYDAKGRIVAVIRTGSVNNGVNTTYQHDGANNRQRVVVTGAQH